MNELDLLNTISNKKTFVKVLKQTLQFTQQELFDLELELINKTPTVKMKAVLENDISIEEYDWEDIIFDDASHQLPSE